MIKLIECPRDAMQSLKKFIPTEQKIDYINTLLQVGFDTLDFGSFVSPKAIPQLRDTAEVVQKIDMSSTNTKLLAIIGNVRGATDALQFAPVSYLGFPFSISKTFLNLNIKSTYHEALKNIDTIYNLAAAKNKEVVVYLSMAFGNPYGDECCEDYIFEAIEQLKASGIKIINLADTVGVGQPGQIGAIFNKVIHEFPDVEFGLHLHTTPKSFYEKIDDAYTHGCQRFDSVMMGLGGCPLSAQELIGNLSTENLLSYFEKNSISVKINQDKYLESKNKANLLFP